MKTKTALSVFLFILIAACFQYIQGRRWQGRFHECAYIFVTKSTATTTMVVKNEKGLISPTYPLNNASEKKIFNNRLMCYHLIQSSPEFGGECRVVFGWQFGRCKPPDFTLNFTNDNGTQIINYKNIDELNKIRPPHGSLVIQNNNETKEVNYYIINLDI